MKRNLSVLFVFSFVLSSLSSSLFVSAQEPDTSVQARCFADLKENMKESVIFSNPAKEIDTMTYADLSSKFSQKYKELQSFGIGVDTGVFAMRTYSFGNQTGYIHPPKSMFPDSYKSDTWASPSKEYIVAEEYVTDTQGKEHFINCLFLQIASTDLTHVTQDRYNYDGIPLSISKNAPDGSYKALYSEAESFDYKNKPFVIWKRLFIYPKATQNSYFNRYDVADEYLANKVGSFEVLKFFLQDIVKVNDVNTITGTSSIKYLLRNKDRTTTPLITPQALIPATLSDGASSPLFNQYPKAIEKQFPEFAKLLSVRGVIKYETIKRIQSETNQNPEVVKFLNAMSNPAIDAYYLATQTGSTTKIAPNPEYDRLIPLIQNGDWTIRQLERGAKLDIIKVGDKDFEPSQSQKNEKSISSRTLGFSMLGIFAVLSIGAGAFFWRKRNAVIVPVPVDTPPTTV
jgi:hypothetical protein